MWQILGKEALMPPPFASSPEKAHKVHFSQFHPNFKIQIFAKFNTLSNTFLKLI